MTTDPELRAQLRDAVLARRRALGLDQNKCISLAGAGEPSISRTRWQRVEYDGNLAGERTLLVVARVLHWDPSLLDAVRNGTMPVEALAEAPLPRQQGVPEPDRLASLEQRVEALERLERRFAVGVEPRPD